MQRFLDFDYVSFFAHDASGEAAGAAGEAAGAAGETEQGRDLQEHLREDDQPMNESPSQEHEQEAQEIPTVRAPWTPRPRGPGGRERRPRGGQHRDVWKSYFRR